ncbi:GNAT family N-acetyltransferase [Phytomonospora sp. NPDC050363]|uniref:GNAT family N-acetyltransferase n=1 Tax=Phytomonospora sp. NPDC050363 TaxID=3155642 RepID=UPI0033D9DBBC
MIAHPLPVLVNAWGVGWALSRATPAPVEIPGGFRVDVGDHGHRVRHVFHTYDRDLLAAVGTEPGTWIKTAGELPPLPGWTHGPPGHLMTVELRQEKAEPPEGYTLRIEEGAVLAAVIETADGTPAAAAHLAAAGDFAVVDRVSTEPAHRRRGLGRVAVRALTSRAAETGASTGVLVATDVGRDLYTAMGWGWRGHLPSVFRPE